MMAERRRSADPSVRTGAMRIGGPWSTSRPVLLSMTGVLVLDRLGTDLERTGEPALLVTSALVAAAAITMSL